MNSPARFSLPVSAGPVADIATILVPIDCGPRSRALLQSASALSRAVGGHLVILHVYEPLTYAPAHCSAEQLRLYRENRHRMAEGKLELLQDEFLDDAEVQAATLLAIEGLPQDKICETALRTHADLIVASTHGYRGLNHLFVGSTAEHLIRRVPCPILILPTAVEGSENVGDVIGLHSKPSNFPPHERNTP
ncbi:MAG TPA: universal stress protein [Chthoniobacterales bacterium]|jgi:nucleotide-binding universal stress UspA family protein